MAAVDLRILYFMCLFLPVCIRCLPEAGIKTLKFDQGNRIRGFPKSLFKDATISMTGKCKSDKKVYLKIQWKLKETQCAQDFVGVKETMLDPIFSDDKLYPELRQNSTKVLCTDQMKLPDVSGQEEFYPTVITTITTQPPTKKTQKSTSAAGTEKGEIVPPNDPDNDNTAGEKKQTVPPNDPDNDNTAGEKKQTVPPNDPDNDNTAGEKKQTVPPNGANNEVGNDEQSETQKRRKRDSESQNNDTPKSTLESRTVANQSTTKKSPVPNGKNQVAVTYHDAIYFLIMEVDPDTPEPKFEVEWTVKMKSKTGYLSATDWPLLPFYGIMSLVYLLYGIIWLVVSACQWRDLLRIQFWIGGVIALGMLEKAVFYSEYNDLNQTGIPKASLVVFAELVSCLKRTLARILVIIVSMGFGIVKPRLGSVLHRVLSVGVLYFILGSVEGGFRALSPKEDPSKQQLIANIPLAVLDAAICWWIFMSLVQTTRTLRIRRNVVKLTLYRHFTNTLIFAVLVSVAYMIWSIKTHKFSECLSDWSELWLDEAFWHFLFSLLLLVIMILWRPTANNQRYAFTPLVDFGDDDDEDNITLSEAFEGMKMRPRQGNMPEVLVNGDRKSLRAHDDDLKWVEENIPTSGADTVLPSVLDSDEELMTRKFEMSKME